MSDSKEHIKQKNMAERGKHENNGHKITSKGLTGRGLSLLRLALRKEETSTITSQKTISSTSSSSQKRKLISGLSPQKNIFVTTPVKSAR